MVEVRSQDEIDGEKVTEVIQKNAESYTYGKELEEDGQKKVPGDIDSENVVEESDIDDEELTESYRLTSIVKRWQRSARQK